MKSIRSQASFVLLAALLSGCSTLKLTVDAPPPPVVPESENDLAKARFVALSRGRDGKGLVAVQVTNKTDKPLQLGGSQGASLPTLGENKAWLVFRGHHDLKRFAKTDLKVELGADSATVSIDTPPEGVADLPPGQSRIVLMGFESAPDAKEIQVDLGAIVVGNALHAPDGQLRTLYLTVPLTDGPTLAKQARELIEKTKVGFQLTSDDI